MGGKVQDKGIWRMRTCLQLLSICWLHVCKKKHHDTRNYTEFLNIYVHLHSFLTNFSPYCFTDTQTDPSISVSPLFPNLITLFSLSSFVSTSHRSLALSLSGWGEEAIMISMETAQQQAWSWQPIRVCFGTVSHPMRRAEEEGVQGGVVGCQGEYSGRCEHFLVGLRTSASQSWGEAIFQLYKEVISLVNSVWIENKFTFQQLCRTSGKRLHHLPANKMDCAH